MDGLLSFLVFGLLFYVMMRYGCGAHMIHGHGGHVGHHSPSGQPHLDPVCRMIVPLEQGYGKMHDGTLYRFCSRDCLDKFEADPARYVKAVEDES